MDYQERKKQLIKIFEDTMEMSQAYDVTKSLQDSYVSKTRGIEVSIHKFDDTEVLFWPLKTTVAARKAIELYGKNTCMLNFASQHTPGGWVLRGSSAQEESMCRSTTLYRVISNPEFGPIFYKVPVVLDESLLIYTPDVKIIKDENAYNYSPLAEAVSVNVITCAAPNLKFLTCADEELYKAHVVRAQNIINEAVRNRNEILITGAFGCGAYRNNPTVVSKVWADLLNGQFKGAFSKIIFAIPYSKDWDILKRQNMEVFMRAFGKDTPDM